MYVLSETLAAAMAAGNPQRIRLEFEDGTVFNNEDISGEAGVKLSHDFNSETDLTIGLCPSAELTFDLLNDTFQLEDFEFGTFTAWIGARIDSGTPGEDAKTEIFSEGGRACLYEFAPIGTFIADRPDVVHKNVISVTAHDQMTLFDETLPDDLTITYPITAAALLQLLCEYEEVDVESYSFLNASVQLTKKPKDIADKTMRQIIGWIAELACANARFNRDGKLEISWLNSTDKTFTEHDHTEFSQAWFESAVIDGLRIRFSSASSEYSVGDGENIYLIQENPFLIPGRTATSTAGAAIYERLHSVAAYHPASAELFSDWTVEPGDIISVTSDGETYSVPVFDFSLDWKGDAMLSVQSTGNKTRAELPEWKRQRYGTSKRNNEEYVTYESLSAGTIEVINIGAGQISAGTLSSYDGYFSEIFVENSVHCVDVYIGYGGEEESVEDALLECVTDFGTPVPSGGQISIPYTKWGGDTGTINFNIADTAYYQNGVSAARTDGWDLARSKVSPPGQDDGTTFVVGIPSATYDTQDTYTFTMVKGATPGPSGYASVTLGQTRVARIPIGDWYSAGFEQGIIAAGGSYQSGYSTGVSDTKAVVQAALGSAGWNGDSGKPTQIYATLDTTNKRLTVTQAYATIQYPGDASASTVSISLGNLDLFNELTLFEMNAEAAGKRSVTLTKGDWSNGTLEIATNNSHSESVSLTSSIGSWDADCEAIATIYDNASGSNVSTGYRLQINAQWIRDHAVTGINSTRLTLPSYDQDTKILSSTYRIIAQGTDGDGDTLNLRTEDILVELDATDAYDAGHTAGYRVTQSQFSHAIQQPQRTEPTTGTQLFGNGISYSSYRNQYGDTIYVRFAVTVHGTTKNYWFKLTA